MEQGKYRGIHGRLLEVEKLHFSIREQQTSRLECIAFQVRKKLFRGKMGKLDFTDIEIKVLSNNIVYVLGRWKLSFKDSSNEGLFTIIFQRKPEGWRIIHDHTS